MDYKDVVFVSRSYLSDIANSIRRKMNTTTKYKPREMAAAIDNIKTGMDSSVVNGLLKRDIQSIEIPNDVTRLGDYALSGCYNLFDLKIPNNVKYISEFALDNSNIQNISIDADYNAIFGKPWGTNSFIPADIVWLRGTKYPITFEQTPNQTITVRVDGKSFTKSFEYYKGAEIAVTVEPNTGYQAGTPSVTSTVVSGPITITATEATKNEKHLFGTTVINKNDTYSKMDCSFRSNDESSKNDFSFTNEKTMFILSPNIIAFSLYPSKTMVQSKFFPTTISTDAFSDLLATMEIILYKENTFSKIHIINPNNNIIINKNLYNYSQYVIDSCFWGLSTATVSGTTDDVSTVMNDIVTAYNNGENIVVELRMDKESFS